MLSLLVWVAVVAVDAPAPEPAPLEVRVRGVARVQPEAAGDFRINTTLLRDVPRASAEALLTLAPGLVLTNHGGQFHASGILLRGFDAGEGQDLEVSVQGIPVNEVSNPHGHGYADTHFVIPQLVQSLRVVEGPFDPRQGDFAVAGSAQYELGLPSRGVRAVGAYGSFDRRRLTLLWGPKTAGPGSFVGVDFEDGSGFGPNRAFAAARLMAQHEVRVNAEMLLRILISSYATRYDSAGVIRRDAYLARRLACDPSRDAQFFCLYDPNQGGASSRHSASIEITDRVGDVNAGASAFVTWRDMRLRQNFTGFSTDLDSNGLAQRGDGTEQSYGAVTVGSRGHLRYEPGPASNWLGLAEVGYHARSDAGSSTVRRLRTVDGVPYRVDADDDVQVNNLAVYTVLRVSPWRRLRLMGGVRADAFLFSVTDHNRPTSDRIGSRLSSDTNEAYGLALQPKLAAQLTLATGWKWLTSAGVGTRSSYAQALSAGEFAPFARVMASESGLQWERRLARSGVWDARLLGFYTHLQRDLLFDERAGRNVAVGASNRFGAMLSSRLELPPRWDVMASATYAEAYLPPPIGRAWGFTRGQRLPYVPRWVARADMSWHRPFVVRQHQVTGNVAAGFTYMAPRPLPFAQFSPAVVTLDLAARIALGRVQVGVEGTNLLDRRNRDAVFNYASNFRGSDAAPSLLPVQHFSAGAPRTLMLSVGVSIW